MSVTRAEDRPGRSHVPPTPPAKLAPADDPAWAHTLALAALAREARPTTTNEETTMADTPAKGLEWIADRLDQLNANAVTMFEGIDERGGNGEDIDCDTDGVRHQSIGASIAYGTAARMVREALAPPTDKDDTRTLEWNGVTVTIGTSSGVDGAALVIIDTDGEPDGSDGWKGLRVDVNDGQVFEGVPLVLADEAPAHPPTCCCRAGAAVSGEYPEFPCHRCPVHGGEFDDGPDEMCRRHRSEAPAFPTDGSMETAP